MTCNPYAVNNDVTENHSLLGKYMTKIDLNNLERQLRGRSGCPDLDPNWPLPEGGRRGPRLCVSYPKCQCGKEDKHVAVTASRPEITLSLIARNRELEEALNDALGYTIPGEDRDRLVEVLAKGAVLP